MDLLGVSVGPLRLDVVRGVLYTDEPVPVVVDDDMEPRVVINHEPVEHAAQNALTAATSAASKTTTCLIRSTAASYRAVLLRPSRTWEHSVNVGRWQGGRIAPTRPVRGATCVGSSVEDGGSE